MKNLFSILLSLTLFSLVIAGCSGESDTDAREGASTDTETRTIEVIGIDKLKFVVAEQDEGLQTGEEITVNGSTYYLLTGINASPGEELTINLKTISNLPAQAMSHNWLLLQPEADAKAFNDASVQAKDNAYVAPEMENLVIIDTGLVADGESKSITFNAPEQTGDYDYICTFPGHFAAGMKGTLTVE